MVISENCRDLLESLLQRDPAKRISFDEFFRHPFIDLDHAPSPKCLSQAVSLAIHSSDKANAAMTFPVIRENW